MSTETCDRTSGETPTEAHAGNELADHHLHGALRLAVEDRDLQFMLPEANLPIPQWRTAMASQVGFATPRWGPAEIPYVGIELRRRSVATALGVWVDAGDWSPHDAIRVAEMTGRFNAERVYGLELGA